MCRGPGTPDSAKSILEHLQIFIQGTVQCVKLLDVLFVFVLLSVLIALRVLDAYALVLWLRAMFCMLYLLYLFDLLSFQATAYTFAAPTCALAVAFFVLLLPRLSLSYRRLRFCCRPSACA